MERKKSNIKEQWGAGLRRMQSLTRKSRSMPEQDMIGVRRLSRQRQERPVQARTAEEIQAEQEQLKDASIAALPEGYFEEDFDAVLHHLKDLPPRFHLSELDTVVEDLSNVLEFVSERLSKHVLANYDVFVQGINEAASVEVDLEGAHSVVKSLRGRLAAALTEVKANMAIVAQQRQNQGLCQMADILSRLQQAAELQTELQSSQENSEYAESFWLCAQCCKSLETLQGLRVTGELLDTINRLYEDTIKRLEGALASACTDFNGDHYTKVLEGYGYLGNIATLGEEVNGCFAGVVNSSALKVVRGVVLTRAGMEDRARTTTMLQEIVKWLPPDLFRQCLARVLMVLFDILASHYHMLQWHQAKLQQHAIDLAALRKAKAIFEPHNAAETGVSGNDSLEEPVSSGRQEAGEEAATEATGNGAGSLPVMDNGHVESIAAPHQKTSHDASSLHGSSALAHRRMASSSSFRGLDSAWMPLEGSLSSLSNGHAGPDEADRPASSTGVALSVSSLPAGEGDAAELDELSASEQLAVLEQREEGEAAWGEALARVSEGLTSGRRWLWDEAARKVGVLLAAPAAFQGEHFLQVGEAFTRSESSTLREAMQRHSGRFFQAYHSANMQALQTMLEQELWKRLPMPSGRQPDLLSALEGTGASYRRRTFDTNSFPEWVAAGNPWRKQAPGSTAEEEMDLPSARQSDDEAEELNGNVDEESQRVLQRSNTGADASFSGRPDGDASAPTMTNASWRMLQWMKDYAELMRMLRTDTGKVYSSSCELFDLYFLHVFHTFSDVTLAEIMDLQQNRQGGADVVPVRLKNAIRRILGRSLHRYRNQYLPPPPMPTRTIPGSQGPMAGAGGPPPQVQDAANGTASRAATALSNPGNMYGLLERKVAVDSLLALAVQLQRAHDALGEKLVGRSDVPEYHVLDTFYQTVKAAGDLRDVVLRAAARLNLPIGWIPERLSEQNFNLEEPPTKASPWVGVLLQHMNVFRQRLETVGSLAAHDIDLLWQFGAQFSAEVVLEGLARAGSKGRCTPMGRSAMSLDLQGLQRGLQGMVASTNASQVVDTLRIVDSYIKAYYNPWGDELRRWALTHPEYTRDQIMMLVACIADSGNIKRRDRNALLTQIEADLRSMR